MLYRSALVFASIQYLKITFRPNYSSVLINISNTFYYSHVILIYSLIELSYVIISFQESIDPLPRGSVSLTIKFHTPVNEASNK